MRKTFLVFLVALLGFSHSLIAQTNFWNSNKAYLGQTLPTGIPLKYLHQGCWQAKESLQLTGRLFLPDGRRIYYCTNTTWAYNSQDLKVKYFKYDGEKWIGPIILNEHMGQTAFSPDNNTLYFKRGDSANMVFRSTRTKTGWSSPTSYNVRNYLIYDFMPTISGNKYAASNGTWGQRLPVLTVLEIQRDACFRCRYQHSRPGPATEFTGF